MKQSLQLKMGQSLTMTPQLQQAIRLLQLSTLDLQNEIQEALDTNPMLEISEESSSEEKPQDTEQNNANQMAECPDLNQDEPKTNEPQETANTQTDSEWNQDIPEDLPVDTSWDDVYQNVSHTRSAAVASDETYETQNTTIESLHDHLRWQLNLTPFSERDHSIALTLIDDIKPCGMLSSEIEESYQSLSDSIDDLELDEVLAVLHRLQQFDPPGVASQNLSDCLCIQIKQLQHHSDTPIFGLSTALRIATEHLSLLAGREYKTLMRKLKVKEGELKAAIQIIQSTNPRPGEDIGNHNAEYVVPDVFVTKKNNRWVVELNPDIAPKIRINDQYANLIKRADTSSDNTFLKDNLQEAKWFLKSLQSRNETLLKVASAIVEKQRGFLDFGEEAMKPLVLHDIAEIVEMHESTISRVTTNKYMHTPKGILELKYFFSSHVSTDGGGECSSTAIRAIIKKLISAENTAKPLSDNKITALLGEQGIKVARRTIAKYRESMSIPPSNERKQLL